MEVYGDFRADAGSGNFGSARAGWACRTARLRVGRYSRRHAAGVRIPAGAHALEQFRWLRAYGAVPAQRAGRPHARTGICLGGDSSAGEGSIAGVSGEFVSVGGSEGLAIGCDTAGFY